MKTNFIKQGNYLSHYRSNSGESAFTRRGVEQPERRLESEIKQDIMTDRPTTRVNTSGSVCFKGSGNFIQKIATSETFNKMAKYVANNEAMFSATTTLCLGITVKPLLTMAMPGAKKKDKTAIAAKNIVSAAITFVMAKLVMKPINIAVIKLTQNPSKYIKGSPELVDKLSKGSKTFDKNFQDAFTAFWKNIPDSAISPIKASLCVLFTPVVINMLGFSKKKKAENLEKIEKEINNMDNLNVNNNPAFEIVANGGVK